MIFFICKTLQMIDYLDAFENGYRIILFKLMQDQKEQDLSHLTVLFLEDLKSHISEQNSTLRVFVQKFKADSSSIITIDDFTLLAQTIKQHELFDTHQIFFQMAKNTKVLTYEALSHSLSKLEKIKMDNQSTTSNQSQNHHPHHFERKCLLGDNGKRVGKTGFNILCRYLLTHREKIERVFGDCENSKSKAIDRNACSRLLYASGIKEFQNKDMRRYLVTFIFDSIEGESLTKEEFVKLFRKYVHHENHHDHHHGHDHHHHHHHRHLNRHHHETSWNASMVEKKNTEVKVERVFSLEVEMPEHIKGSLANHENHNYSHSHISLGATNLGDTSRRTTNNLLTDASFLPFNLVLNVAKLVQPAIPKIIQEHKQKSLRQTQIIQEQKQKSLHQAQVIQEQKQKSLHQAQVIQEQKIISINTKKDQAKKANNSQFSSPQAKKSPAHKQHKKTKDFLEANKYFRLGDPDIEFSHLTQELQQLLTYEKEYFDMENPIADADYIPATKIFKNSGYNLFDLSSEEMNRNRQDKTIGKFIEADDIIQGKIGDCYFLSALGSLAAEYPQIISQKFLFEVNPAGYYAIRLFIDGQWTIIQTDDFFPVKQEKPHYAKPHGNEIWVMLIQKAFSKVFGSYEAIDGGSSEEAFNALTGAPTYQINFKINSDLQALKLKTEQACKNHYLMATSFSNQSKAKYGLFHNHAYSLFFIKSFDGLTFIKLRNPWGKDVWKGNWSYHSKNWTPKLRRYLQYQEQKDDGIFYMEWRDFCQYFDEITVCKINPMYFHTSFPMVNNQRKSNYIRMTITTPGTYSLSIWQESRRKHKSKDPGFIYSNSRIIVMKEGQKGKLTYVGAMNTTNQQVCNVDVQLKAGTYIISAKVAWEQWVERECFLVGYGVQKVNFELMEKAIAPHFKQNLIETFAAVKNCSPVLYSENGVQFSTEKYFSGFQGLGFIKVTNMSKKKIELQYSFQLGTIKLIKPATNPHVIKFEQGNTEIVGFMVPADCHDDFGYKISYKVFK